MKKLLNTIAAMLVFTSLSFAQEAATAVSSGASALSKSMTSGEYSFVLPPEVTSERVEESSKYYTHYFTTSFDAGSNTVKIVMSQNDEKSRFVIARFLGACGVRNVKVDDKTLDMQMFIENHLQ